MTRLICQSVLLVAALAALCCRCEAQRAAAGGGQQAPAGLSINEPGALDGYTLIFSLQSTMTHLVDMQGRVVHQWESAFAPASSAYLMANGDLVRPGAESGSGPTSGGRIQRFNWDGELIWDYSITALGRELQPHHDICVMPNGNVLVIAFETKDAEQADAVGRPINGRMQADCVLELRPVGKDSAEVVWEWRVWDHLVQDVNEHRPTFGDVAQHPELIDANFGNAALPRMKQNPQTLAQLQARGYFGGAPMAEAAPAAGGNSGQPPRAGGQGGAPRFGGSPGMARGGGGGRGGVTDWMHTNAIDYNPELDQIILSVHGFSELWVIDHSTTTAEAASHAGGAHGKGGDLLYRWGNPQAYRHGDANDQRLYRQHNTHWIPPGLPGAGNVMVFNNGQNRPDGSYSSVDELALPVNSDGGYARAAGQAFEPARVVWSYTAEDKPTFFSHFISGAQRLPNGNTLICSGANGIVFEVTPDKQTVWRYRHPIGHAGRGGARAGGGPDGLFRSYRYAADHAAFAGRTLTPGADLVDVVGGRE